MSLNVPNIASEYTLMIPKEMFPYILGIKKDYSHTQDLLLKISITFAGLVVVSTILRLWVRFRMLRVSGLDDILMIIASVFALLLSASCLVARHFGLGKHIWNLAPVLTDIPKYTAIVTKCLYACYLSYALAIAFVKFSIIATYFRLFPDGLLRRTITGVGVVCVGLLICNIFTVIFTCVPVRAAWTYNIEGKCINVVDFFYASSSINIATDLALCFLPIPTLWKLQMPRSQRIILCGLFALGAFTCIASIMRVISLQAVTGDGHVDFSYNTVGGLNWCIVEVGTAILCSSLSSIRPLLAKYLPKIFNHTTANISTKQSKSNQKGKAFKLGDFSSTGKSGDTTGWKNDTEMGEIVVEQTFDVKEEWDPRNEKRESTWGRIRGDRSSKKIEMVTKEKRSDSEEVLVIQSNNLPYPCPGRPI